MTAYQSIQLADDGDYVTDYNAPTIEDVWDLVNDQGSRWYFYPYPFVITAKADSDYPRSHGSIGRKRIVSACDGYDWAVGLTVATVAREFAAALSAAGGTGRGEA